MYYGPGHSLAGVFIFNGLGHIVCILQPKTGFFYCLLPHEVFFFTKHYSYQANLPAIAVIEKDVIHIFCNTSKATKIFD